MIDWFLIPQKRKISLPQKAIKNLVKLILIEWTKQFLKEYKE